MKRPEGRSFGREVLSLYKSEGPWIRFSCRYRYHFSPFEEVLEYVPPHGTCVDVGCGYGLFANMLAIHSKDRFVIGLDIDAARIQVAEKTLGGRQNIVFLRSAPQSLQMSSCRSIIVFDVLHHLTGSVQEEVMKVCYEKLEPNGMLVIKDVGLRPRWKYAYNWSFDRATKLLGVTSSMDCHYRSSAEWLTIAERIGYRAKEVEMRKKDLAPHILILAQKWLGKDRRPESSHA